MSRIAKFILRALVSFRRWIARAWGWLYALACRLITVGEVAGVIALWVLFFLFHQSLKQNKNQDPLEGHSGPGGGGESSPALTYERKLASGETIRINNANAIFIGDVEDDARAGRLFPNFAAAVHEAREAKLPLLPSASLIHHRLKREDDRLIEAMQLENHKTLIELLQGLEVEMATSSTVAAREAAAFVAGGLMLTSPTLSGAPEVVQARARELIEEFESGSRSEAQSRGFNDAIVARRYQRSAELARMFKTQRFLMGELDANGARALKDALARRPELRAKLGRVLRAEAHWNNPPETPHLLTATTPETAGAGVCLIPYAQTPENRYYLKKYGRSAMPPGASWMDDIIEGVRTGRMEFRPRPESGWYDHKFYALTPLVREDQSAALRTGKLNPMPAYGEFMEETFRAALTGLRETHVLSVGPPPLCIGGGDGTGPLELAPEFSCEPEPSLYWRLALAYRFLAQGLEIGSPARLETKRLEETARGIAAVSVLELGLRLTPPSALEQWRAEDTARLHEDARRGRAWLDGLLEDPVLAEDPRISVDAASGRKWGIAGVRLRRLRYDYQDNPKVEKRSGIDRRPAYFYAPVLVAAEFTRPIPGDDFAAFCDKYRRVGDCLAALGAVGPTRAERALPLWVALTLLTAFVLAHVIWWNRAITRRRRNGPARSWRRRWRIRLAWLFVLFLLYYYGSLIVVLFLVPKIELPQRERASWCAGLSSLFARNAFFLERFAHDNLFLPPQIPEAVSPRQLINIALSSNTRAVREVALNAFNYMWDRNGQYSIYSTGLYDVCRKRGYAEAQTAFSLMLNISGAENFRRLREIYHQYADPALILWSAGAIKTHGSPEDVAELELAVREGAKRFPAMSGAVQKGDRILWERWSREEWGLGIAVESLLQTKPEMLPYDRMVDWGLFPKNPDDGTTMTLKGWLEQNYQPVISSFFSHQRSIIESAYYGDPEKKISSEMQRKVAADLRPAMLAVKCYGQRSASVAAPCMLTALERLSQPQKEYVLKWLGDYLTQLPADTLSQEAAGIIMEAIVRYVNGYAQNKCEAAFVDFLRRLIESPWNDRPNPRKFEPDPATSIIMNDMGEEEDRFGPTHCKTCGAMFKKLIAELQKQAATDPNAINPATGMPLGLMR